MDKLMALIMDSRTVRIPSKSEVKHSGIKLTFADISPLIVVTIIPVPVELHLRTDLSFNAQPWNGEAERYVRARDEEMRKQNQIIADYDVIIESEGFDTGDPTDPYHERAVVLVRNIRTRKEHLIYSTEVSMPADAVEKARNRGFKTTTIGDVIHEENPEIPADNWQETRGLSRDLQIAYALVESGMLWR